MEMGVPPALLPDPNNWITSRQYTGRVVTFTNSDVFEQATFNYSRMFGFRTGGARRARGSGHGVEQAGRVELPSAADVRTI